MVSREETDGLPWFALQHSSQIQFSYHTAHNPLSDLPISCSGVQEPHSGCMWQKQHDKGLLLRLWEDKSFYGLIITSWWRGRGSSDSNLVPSSPPSTKRLRGSLHLLLPASPVNVEILVFESLLSSKKNINLLSHSTKAPLAWTLAMVLVRWSAPYLQPHTEDSSFLPMLWIFYLHPHRKSSHFKQQVFLPTAGSGAHEHLCIHTGCLLYAIWARWIQPAEKEETRPYKQNTAATSLKIGNLHTAIFTAVKALRSGTHLITNPEGFFNGSVRSRWYLKLRSCTTDDAFILTNGSFIRRCFLGWEPKKTFW